MKKVNKLANHRIKLLLCAIVRDIEEKNENMNFGFQTQVV